LSTVCYNNDTVSGNCVISCSLSKNIIFVLADFPLSENKDERTCGVETVQVVELAEDGGFAIKANKRQIKFSRNKPMILFVISVPSYLNLFVILYCTNTF